MLGFTSTLANMCERKKYAALKPVIAKLKTLECKTDGVHRGGKGGNLADMIKDYALDITIAGGRWSYHWNGQHANLDEMIEAAIKRTK